MFNRDKRHKETRQDDLILLSSRPWIDDHGMYRAASKSTSWPMSLDGAGGLESREDVAHTSPYLAHAVQHSPFFGPGLRWNFQGGTMHQGSGVLVDQCQGNIINTAAAGHQLLIEFQLHFTGMGQGWKSSWDYCGLRLFDGLFGEDMRKHSRAK